MTDNSDLIGKILNAVFAPVDHAAPYSEDPSDEIQSRVSNVLAHVDSSVFVALHTQLERTPTHDH